VTPPHSYRDRTAAYLREQVGSIEHFLRVRVVADIIFPLCTRSEFANKRGVSYVNAKFNHGDFQVAPEIGC
jgi:hypothetical protein